jgi:hypothetical protein
MAQNAISFDSLSLGYSCMTENAIYFNSNRLVKSDYLGNIIWAITGAPTNSRIKAEGNGIYIYTNNGLTKLDTSGIILWSQNFTQNICLQSTVANSIADVLINMNRIFVLINQPYLGVGFAYPSLITLDTSGTIINTWCGDNYADLRIEFGVAKSDGGALLIGYDGGAVHTGISLQVEQNGTIKTGSYVQTFQAAQFNNTNAVLTKSNFVHCYFVNSFTVPYPRVPYILFESDLGGLQSYFSFETPGITDGTYIFASGKDSSDNLFFLASSDGGEIVLFKTNPYGIPIIIKGWSTAAINSLGLNFPQYPTQVSMYGRNDSLYVTCSINNKASVLSFDENLDAFCYSPDMIVQSFSSVSVSMNTFIPYNEFSIAYNAIPVSLQELYTNQANGISVCQITSTELQENKKRGMDLSPNPFSNSTILNVSREFENGEIDIYNLLGTHIRNQKLKGLSSRIERMNMAPGLYIIKIRSKKQQIMRKFIVE